MYAKRLNEGRCRQSASRAHHHGQRAIWPSSTPTLKLRMRPSMAVPVVAQRQLLQAGGQAKAVQQAKAEHHPQQAGRRHLKMLLEAAVVVKGLVHDAEGDDGVDQVVVPGDVEQGGKDQRDAVPHREHGDELDDVLERGQEEHHAEEEQQVVVAGEHVAGAQAHVLQVAAVEHALAVGLGNAVGQRDQRREGEQQPGGRAAQAKKFHEESCDPGDNRPPARAARGKSDAPREVHAKASGPGLWWPKQTRQIGRERLHRGPLRGALRGRCQGVISASNSRPWSCTPSLAWV